MRILTCEIDIHELREFTQITSSKIRNSRVCLKCALSFDFVSMDVRPSTVSCLHST